MQFVIIENNPKFSAEYIKEPMLDFILSNVEFNKNIFEASETRAIPPLSPAVLFLYFFGFNNFIILLTENMQFSAEINEISVTKKTAPYHDKKLI